MIDRKELEKLPLTREEKERWAAMMHRTWNAIGSDAAELGPLTKGMIVELVLDANRVQHYGGMTDEEYEYLSTQYGKPAFQRWARGVMNY